MKLSILLDTVWSVECGPASAVSELGVLATCVVWRAAVTLRWAATQTLL